MSNRDPSDSSPPPPPDMKLPQHWSCVACGHYETSETIRCSSCDRFRGLGVADEPLIAIAPMSGEESESNQKSPEDQRLLGVAFDRLQELFKRAQAEGRTLNEADRAKLYETLLISFLKIEREEVRRVAFRESFQEDREERKRSHMIHLSIIWFLGICTGFALYFALDSVR